MRDRGGLKHNIKVNYTFCTLAEPHSAQHIFCFRFAKDTSVALVSPFPLPRVLSPSLLAVFSARKAQTSYRTSANIHKLNITSSREVRIRDITSTWYILYYFRCGKPHAAHVKRAAPLLHRLRRLEWTDFDISSTSPRRLTDVKVIFSNRV